MSGTMNIVLFLASTKQEQGCCHYGMRFEAVFIFFFQACIVTPLHGGGGIGLLNEPVVMGALLVSRLVL